MLHGGLLTSNVQPRYNVCPTDTIDAIIFEDDERKYQPMRWSLVPSWWKKTLKEWKVATFNARLETVEEKATFKKPWARKQRCVIPVSGYYEWQDMGKKEKPQPWYFTNADGSPIISIAGIWDEWKSPEGEVVKSCAMIITEPNKFVAEVHDRMPVLLTKEQFVPWLAGDMEREELLPAPEGMLQKWLVSQRVNSSLANDEDAALIDRIDPVNA